MEQANNTRTVHVTASYCSFDLPIDTVTDYPISPRATSSAYRGLLPDLSSSASGPSARESLQVALVAQTSGSSERPRADANLVCNFDSTPLHPHPSGTLFLFPHPSLPVPWEIGQAGDNFHVAGPDGSAIIKYHSCLVLVANCSPKSLSGQARAPLLAFKLKQFVIRVEQ